VSALAAAASTAIGVWLMAAPGVLDYGEPMASVHRIVGPVAAAVSLVALWPVVRAVLRANLVVALVLLGAIPFELSASVLANGLACGLALGALALVPIRGDSRFAGGWIGLVRRRGAPSAGGRGGPGIRMTGGGGR
jgi:hypothetical protein